MKVEDYLRFVAQLKQVEPSQVKTLVERALVKTQLLDVRHRLIQNLSKGFKQRVGIAQALVSEPEVLVLDEPTVGLDPKQVAEIRDLIKELRGEHTIILSTHILPEVQATCNKVIIIHQGVIVAEDSIEGLEKLNKGTLSLTIKTKKKSSLESTLKAVTGVLGVEKISDLHFKIKLQEQDELIEKIASEVIRSGAGLMELVPTRANLEDVFLKLTYGQDGL